MNLIKKGFPLGCIHPGYGKNYHDTHSWHRAKNILRYFEIFDIGLETVPPIVDVDKNIGVEYAKETNLWSQKKFWGFGGTPEDMQTILFALRNKWRCLFDFTHIIVAVNQANNYKHSQLNKWKNLDNTIAAYLSLPHWPICHFSGNPAGMTDNHDYLLKMAPPIIKEAICRMKAVCLEISYNPDNPKETEKQIKEFKKMYLS